MPVLFILMLLAYLVSNIYIFFRGLQSIQSFPPTVKWILSILFWIGVFSIGIIAALRNVKIPITWSHLFFEISTGWLVFTLYMTLFLICFDCFRLFNYPIRHEFIFSLGLTVCILAYGYYHYQHPVNKVINIDINKSLADSTSSVKIVAISDIHLGMGTTKKKLQKYVRMINAQEPDLILISGDLIDNSIAPVRDQQMHIELSQLKARLGVFMVPGNHEYISGITDCMTYLNQTPIQFLKDTLVTLPNGIQLVGRDDRSNRSRKELSMLMHRTDANLPVIVLDHQPYELAQSVNTGVDLLFCGHTHNGQVWPMNWLTSKLFDISYGYAKRENTHIYVSSGLALWGPPFRIGSQSEMVVFNIRFNN